MGEDFQSVRNNFSARDKDCIDAEALLTLFFAYKYKEKLVIFTIIGISYIK